MTTPVNASDLYKNEVRQVVRGSTILTVGVDGSYTTIDDAINSITDAAADKEYTVKVLPGSYAPFSFVGHDYITVEGSGHSTVINCTNGNYCSFEGYRNAIKNMKFVYDNDSGGAASMQYCILLSANFGEAIFQDLEFDVNLSNSARTAEVWAIGGTSRNLPTENTSTWGCRLINCNVTTDGGGFRVGSNATVEFFGCTVMMTTRSATYPTAMNHTGVEIVGSGRNFWWGGRISSGYLYDNIESDTGHIYGFNITAISTNTRLNIHDCDGILRNDSTNYTSGDTVFINVPNTVHANCEVRLFGFRGQCEGISTIKEIIRTLYDHTVTGKVYMMDSTLSGSSSGNIAGDRMNLDSTWNLWGAPERDIKVGGKWFCDTTTAFQVNVPKMAGISMHKPLVIFNEFGSGNNITIGQGVGAPTFDIEGTGAAQTSVNISPGTSRVFRLKTDGNYWVK